MTFVWKAHGERVEEERMTLISENKQGFYSLCTQQLGCVHKNYIGEMGQSDKM